MAKKRDLQELDLVSKELSELKKQTAHIASIDPQKAKQKKMIIVLCSILAVLIVGAFTALVVVYATQSPVSYGPKATEAEMTEERTKEHERRLKIIDKNGGIREGVNFVGTYAQFNKDGDLIVDGYMRNFTGHEIYNITGNVTVETAESEEHIGSAYFEFPEDTFGSLKNGKSRPWRLIFDSDYVNVEITDLSKFTVTTELDFYMK